MTHAIAQDVPAAPALPRWRVVAGVFKPRIALEIMDWVRQVRARKAIDNVISSVAYDELRNVLLPTGTGDQILVH